MVSLVRLVMLAAAAPARPRLGGGKIYCRWERWEGGFESISSPSTSARACFSCFLSSLSRFRSNALSDMVEVLVIPVMPLMPVPGREPSCELCTVEPVLGRDGPGPFSTLTWRTRVPPGVLGALLV